MSIDPQPQSKVADQQELKKLEELEERVRDLEARAWELVKNGVLEGTSGMFKSASGR
jgi:hypothetical protein